MRHCNDNFNATKCLLSLTESSTVTGAVLANVMLSTLEHHKFDLNKLCAQTYHGAASIIGSQNGVQAIIRQRVPHTHFIHCRSHSSNLVIVQNVHAERFERNFVGVL